MSRSPRIVLPRDGGRHEWSTDEWWYFNAHLTAADGGALSLVLCFFPSYVLTTLVDVSSKRLLHASVATGKGFEASTDGLDVRFGRSWWREDAGSGEQRIHHEDDGFALDLRALPVKKPIFVNGTGMIREGLLGTSYYYAVTRLEVEGQLTYRGSTMKAKGTGWVERQWGEWDWRGLSGWDWFSIQLQNGVDLLAIRVFQPVSGGVVERTLNISAADGGAEALKDFSVANGPPWKSPETGAEYATGWVLTVPGRLELHIEAVLKGQEVNAGLWEGACTVSGTFEGKSVSGMAFVEQSHGRVHGGKAKRLGLLVMGFLSRWATKASRTSRMMFQRGGPADTHKSLRTLGGARNELEG